MLYNLNMPNLKNLFYPESISVIGVSENTQKIGHIITKNIIESGYQGQLFLVNRKGEKILGKQCFITPIEITTNINVSIICVPANTVHVSLEDLGKQKVLICKDKPLPQTFAIIISAGFRENGEGGLLMETKLLEIAEKYNITLQGPNCLGLMNLDNNDYAYNGTFDFLPQLRGSVSLVSQSGALISAFLDSADQRGFGFNKIISLGNKLGITEIDLVNYLESDESTKIIALYLESFSSPKIFIELLKKIRKPVIILKAGRSDVAKTAATSHTGSIAGNTKIAQVFLASSRAVQVYSLTEFFDIIALFSRYQNVSNQKLAIVTNAGGMGVITLDCLNESEIKLQDLSDETVTQISKFLPPTAKVHNPIDILGDANLDRYEKALNTLVSKENLGSILVILTPQVNSQITETAEMIVNIALKYPKTVIMPVFIGGKLVEGALSVFKKHSLPYFFYPELAINALNNLWMYSKKVATPLQSDILAQHTHTEKLKLIFQKNIFAGNASLDFDSLNKITSYFELKMPKFQYISDNINIQEQFNSFQKPIVLKVVSSNILHRTEKKMVQTNIQSIESVECFLSKHQNEQIIIQEMIQDGLEVFIGVQRDPDFGLTLVLGTGGIYAEAIDDFALGALPQSKQEVLTILKQTKIFNILNGFRSKKWDIDNLIEDILKITNIAQSFEEIKSIDINPYLVKQIGGVALDVKILI